MPVADLSSTPERCEAEPLPAEANVSSPGRAFASAISSTPQEFGAFVASEVAKWGRAIRESGARVE